jgi:hypothetical protein
MARRLWRRLGDALQPIQTGTRLAWRPVPWDFPPYDTAADPEQVDLPERSAEPSSDCS